MKCESCKNEQTEVIDSRPSGETIRRRRRCVGCGHRFTTREVSAKFVEEVVRENKLLRKGVLALQEAIEADGDAWEDFEEEDDVEPGAGGARGQGRQGS